MKLLFLALLCSVPVSLGERRTHVDLIEKNTVYDAKDGKPKFTQVIFWHRYGATGKFHARYFYVLSDREPDPRTPRKTPGGQWEAYYGDSPMSKAYSDGYIETHTVYDPERQDQKFLYLEHRLAMPKGK